MKVIFFGTPQFVTPVLDALLQNHDVVAVVTTPDTPAGRKKIMTQTPVKAHYLNAKPDGVVIDTEQLNNIAIQQLTGLHPDLFVVAAYGKIVPKKVLDIPKYGSLNIHPSLLPKYRGPSPIQTAILNGETTSGITIIQMDEEIDHGPIVAQKELPVEDTDTFASLHVSMFQEAATMLPHVIQEYVRGDTKPVGQDHAKATFCEHITKQDGYFPIENPPSVEKLGRMIRAYFPWPTAWTRIRIKNQESRILKFLPEKHIQLEGGKPMTVKEFLNGYPEMKDMLERLGMR